MKTARKIEVVATTIVAVMILGTVAYHNLEGWGYVDSFYFTGVTVTTIGYGDLHPTTALSKIFTVFFAFGGVGIMLFALSTFATIYFDHRERTIEDALHRKLLDGLKKTVSEEERKRKVNDLIEGSKG
ncbi:MAG: potassium channel family protein [Candidatus Aenigmatarchaeota archaeon]